MQRFYICRLHMIWKDVFIAWLFVIIAFASPFLSYLVVKKSNFRETGKIIAGMLLTAALLFICGVIESYIF
jgi:hypothetical protein